MAFTGNFVCSNFKQELLAGQQNFSTSGGNTFKMALYTNSASLTAATTAYTSSGEHATTGTYTATGKVLTIPASMPSLTATVAWTDFDDLTWAASTITARGALIFNDTSTPADPAVVVLDFGRQDLVVGGLYGAIPGGESTAAIIRIT